MTTDRGLRRPDPLTLDRVDGEVGPGRIFGAWRTPTLLQVIGFSVRTRRSTGEAGAVTGPPAGVEQVPDSLGPSLCSTRGGASRAMWRRARPATGRLEWATILRALMAPWDRRRDRRGPHFAAATSRTARRPKTGSAPPLPTFEEAVRSDLRTPGSSTGTVRVSA